MRYNTWVSTVGELKKILADRNDSETFHVAVYTSGDEGMIYFANGLEIDTPGVY